MTGNLAHNLNGYTPKPPPEETFLTLISLVQTTQIRHKVHQQSPLADLPLIAPCAFHK
jgi:hypothetical protein